ncbi:transcription elongation factor GreAB [Marinomonas sp. C2222]|uniref:Transcription elongation factor GreAB n=1 Tax=Marinomonas sargassi TaxID=2984494 RepID=A0ABT2YTP0_9GAMM|nr:transcription elongation factor GreAB [Marinomonas sargassi]MCV2402974.1 transcription elongation factor GreAB [Marinomonas sargassi]
MKKSDVLQIVKSELKNRLDTAKWAANQAHEAATSKESIAENKYDTFGLEASYLAHGQSQRVIECEDDWLQFNKVDFDLVYQQVAVWCLVQLVAIDDESVSERYFLISSCAGGLKVELGSALVYLVTPSSLVGQKLMGKSVGDEVSLMQSGQEVLFELAVVE